jgi:hypothetical protein
MKLKNLNEEAKVGTVVHYLWTIDGVPKVCTSKIKYIYEENKEIYLEDCTLCTKDDLDKLYSSKKQLLEDKITEVQEKFFEADAIMTHWERELDKYATLEREEMEKEDYA